MDIRVKATGTIGENGSEPWTPEEGITIHYDGNVVGFSVTQEFDWNDAAGVRLSDLMRRTEKNAGQISVIRHLISLQKLMRTER